MTRRCAICELELDTTDRQSIRLSSSQPPWSVRSAGRVAAMGMAFAAVLRAATAEPELTLWFHRDCWQGFRDLLGVARERGGAGTL